MFERKPEYVVYSDADLATMSPLYAAYVTANGMRVPKGRHDLFNQWLTKQRSEYHADPSVRTTRETFTVWLTRKLDLTDKLSASKPGGSHTLGVFAI